MGNMKEGETIIVTTSRGVYSAKALILTTGATYRKLGAVGEDTYFGRGINYCASCDGYLYKGKSVAIIGGGNTALTDALHLKTSGSTSASSIEATHSAHKSLFKIPWITNRFLFSGILWLKKSEGTDDG